MSLVVISSNPAPEGAQVGTFEGYDRTPLRYALFRPRNNLARGTVCLFHGRTEFVEKYFETISDLLKRGFAVATLDWRGQGLSGRATRDVRKGHVRDFVEYDRDLEKFMLEIALPQCPKPMFALSHSMGSAILVRAAAQNRPWFDRFVLASPMFEIIGLRAPRMAQSIARSMRAAGFGRTYVPGGGPRSIATLPFPGNVLTSDPVRYARIGALLEAEPRLAIGSPTVSWLDAAFRAMTAILAPSFASAIQRPVLILASGADRVVSTPAIERFSAGLRTGSHLVIPGAEHELMMEQDRYREQFLAAFDAFVPGS